MRFYELYRAGARSAKYYLPDTQTSVIFHSAQYVCTKQVRVLAFVERQPYSKFQVDAWNPIGQRA